MPPEYIDKGEISFKVDIYSLGVIIGNLLRGEFTRFEEVRKISSTLSPLP